MPYLFVRHKVADFDEWCSVFESHAEDQRESGLRDHQLLRNASDPNIVVCFFKVDDLDRARAFTETQDANEAKKKSGVIGEPEVLWLNEV